MIKANFDSYASYTTDTLYQWDRNQVLNISGLNLSVAPEVHFSNTIMDKAIVRQADLIDHTVSVKIPNSLLQEPLKIEAHIGIYEGDSFKIIEKVLIPVRPKKRPSDYQLEDTDEEIYSFNRVSNDLNNKADNSRVDNIIAHNNDSDGNSELIDIRTGIDGEVYDTAGEAVRQQLKKIKQATLIDMGIVSSTNYKELLPNANLITKSSIYRLNFDFNSSDITANLPYVNFRGSIDTLITLGDTENERNYCRQFLIGYDSLTHEPYAYTRVNNTTPDAWVNMIPNTKLVDNIIPRYVVAKDGSGDFKSLAECFKTHENIKCDIYVRPGTYDLLEEFTALYGDDFIKGTNIYEGLIIDRGKRLFLDAGTKLIFDYSGDVDRIITYFSPIKFSGEGGELHGGYIYCKNGRYCIHDNVYTSEYSKSLISGVYCEKGADDHPVCIGGGMGKHSDIIVENCIFKTPINSNGVGAFYCNSTLEALGFIKITGNYAENCEIYVQGYGPSTEKTPAILTNNKATKVCYKWEIPDDPNSRDNMEFIGFNNIETSV